MKPSEIIKNVYKHACPTCGTKFESYSRHDRYCSLYCSYHHSVNTTYRNRKNNEALYEICREIDNYNKEHGTRLSYGQYMSGRRA